jgi:hypothetical protein
MTKMTCTYYDKAGDQMLEEAIIPNPPKQTGKVETLTKSINIQTSPEKVWAFVNDLSQWPRWAIHNVINSKKGENGFWLMEGPRGISKVKMNADESLGILDHDFIDPAEGHWIVPCRVFAGSEGAHFMITFTKPVQMPDEAFGLGMRQVDEELLKLKEIMEGL